MVRALFFAAFLACRRRHGRQGVMRAALFGTRFAGFFLWNSHNYILSYLSRYFTYIFAICKKKVVVGRWSVVVSRWSLVGG